MRWNSPHSGTSRSTAGHQVGAPFAAGDRMDLVEDDRRDAGKDVPAAFGGEQDIEAFGGGDQDLGRIAQHPPAFVPGRVAASGLDADSGKRHSGML